MSYVLRLPFTRPPVTSNDARSVAHWRAQNRDKKVVAEAVVVAARAALVPRMDRVAVTLTWYRDDRKRCDPDGLAPMLKACVDALTPPRAAIPKGAPTLKGTPRKKAEEAKIGCGVLHDDDARVVASVTMAIVLDDPDPRIELRLDPLPRLPDRPRQRRKATQ